MQLRLIKLKLIENLFEAILKSSFLKSYQLWLLFSFPISNKTWNFELASSNIEFFIIFANNEFLEKKNSVRFSSEQLFVLALLDARVIKSYPAGGSSERKKIWWNWKSNHSGSSNPGLSTLGCDSLAWFSDNLSTQPTRKFVGIFSFFFFSFFTLPSESSLILDTSWVRYFCSINTSRTLFFSYSFSENWKRRCFLRVSSLLFSN